MLLTKKKIMKLCYLYKYIFIIFVVGFDKKTVTFQGPTDSGKPCTINQNKIMICSTACRARGGFLPKPKSGILLLKPRLP